MRGVRAMAKSVRRFSSCGLNRTANDIGPTVAEKHQDMGGAVGKE